MKIPTCLRLNHPVISERFRRHGRELNFAAVILYRSHHADHDRKEGNGCMIANVARMLGVQGAVMTLEGTSNT